MINQLRYQILECLYNSNAVDGTVDIKFDFLESLDTIQKRKQFKVELDYLISEGFIAGGPFDFLNWELISGLYPLDNKSISAKLTRKGVDYIQAELAPHYTDNIVQAASAHEVSAKTKHNNAAPVVSYLIVKDGAPKAPPVKTAHSNITRTDSIAAKPVVKAKPAAPARAARVSKTENPFQELSVITLNPIREQKSQIPPVKILLLAMLGVCVAILALLIYFVTRSRY